MKRFGEDIDLDAAENKSTWESIVSYMDDDIREACHLEYAPCTNEFFLEMYIKRDPEFEDLILSEFGIELQ